MDAVSGARAGAHGATDDPSSRGRGHETSSGLAPASAVVIAAGNQRENRIGRSTRWRMVRVALPKTNSLTLGWP